MIAGSGLQEAETAPRIFESLLRRRGVAVEVINAAGDGYTGWENAAKLESYLREYAPQGVVYHLYPSYIFADRAIWEGLEFKDGAIVGRKSAWAFLWRMRLPESARRFVGRLIWAGWIYRELSERVRASRKLAAMDPEARLEDLLGPTLAEIRQMRSLCERYGARLYVVYSATDADARPFPRGRGTWLARLVQKGLIRPFRVDGDWIMGRLRQEIRSNSCALLQISGARTALMSRANRIEEDYHWNARGARIFAEAVAEAWLRANPGARRMGSSRREPAPLIDRKGC